MLEGIKLLIERMDSHPEEFTGDLSYRWANIMQDIAKHGPEYLDEEDLLALNRKVKEVRRKELNAKVMDEIATQKRLKRAQEEHDEKVMLTTSVFPQQVPKSSGVAAGNTKAWWVDESSKMARINEIMDQTAAYQKEKMLEQNKIQQQNMGGKLWP